MSPTDRSYDVSGLRIEFHDLPAGCAGRLDDAWGQFVSAPEPAPMLDIHCAVRPTTGPAPRRISAQTMRTVYSSSRARFEMPDGVCRLDQAGRTKIRLPSNDAAHQYFTLINLLLPAIAWRLMQEGGAVMHAAGIVLDGRAFLLVGPENAGKSTWVALAKTAGARPLSDDVILVQRSNAGGLEALGSPFRVKDHGSIGPGRWPVAAILLSAHGAAPMLQPVPSLTVRTVLMANLLYATEALEAFPRVDAFLEAATAEVPVRRLTFAKDSSFIDLLRDACFERRDGSDAG